MYNTLKDEENIKSSHLLCMHNINKLLKNKRHLQQ